MTDTTDTARLVHDLRKYYGPGGMAERAAAALERIAAENAELRKAISDCATAVGANAPPTCSAEFLCEVPREVMLVVTGLRADLATHVPVLLEWLGENVTDDPAYLQARAWAHRVAQKAVIDAAMAEGKGDDV